MYSKNGSDDADNINLRKPGRVFFHRRSLLWVIAAISVLVLDRILPQVFVDKWYYQCVFGYIRRGYDLLFGWLPIPMIYLIALIVAVRIVKWSNDWKKGFLFLLSRALGGIALLVACFYLFWALNYRQITLQERLGLQLDDVTQADVEAEFLRATEVLTSEANALSDHYTSDEAIANLHITDNDLRPDVERALATLGVPNGGNVRVRQLWPKGLLMRWSTAGIYIPHAFEGHIDPGMLSIQKPFTIAHEMAHGYGITDEGACNFVAWLACVQSRDQWIRFGGALTYWRYVAAEIPDEEVRGVINTFPPVVTRALVLIRENDKKYPDILPQIRDAIYSSYLKQHGVKGGLRSYNYVVKMVSLYLNKRY
ncbi:MAG: DUF3810 domain-containing protein [Bacteroidota bacterium]|nr:DUF3810 domain-containing protein [Bacteroidota bacterium]